MIILKIKDFENFVIPKKKETILSFRLEEKDLNKNTGKKILNFLKRLNNKKLKFQITRPLPRCVFNLVMIRPLKNLNIPLSCIECKEFYTLTSNGMVKSCEVINKIGPKIEYIKGKEQIWEYFSTFHNEMVPFKKCKSCLFFARKRCNALCFRKWKKE